ncbi:MAG: phosphoribosylglycinamide formyltransferase [Solitalea-like symbiont of Acarus siro]
MILKTKIAIFGSASGSNTQKVVEYFAHNRYIEVALILCNNKAAYVLERAKKLNVNALVVEKKDFNNETIVPELLKEHDINFIVLAGFFLMIPTYLLKLFNKKIVNVHPSLLHKFGGKGFYGSNVHKAVITAKEKISGITIHYVDEGLDTGEIIFQKKYVLKHDETHESLCENITQLEHKYYPIVIEKILRGNIRNECEL